MSEQWTFDETEDLRGMIHSLLISVQAMACHIMSCDPERAKQESKVVHEIIHRIERLRPADKLQGDL